ncbi:hypothetical protein HRD57_06255 [Tetragenococcus halophilus]|nr:hypothetical protein [Tetragenococcus halophilus]
MVEQEIAEIMEEALLKDKIVAVQSNELWDHNYLPDTVGKIKVIMKMVSSLKRILLLMIR